MVELLGHSRVDFALNFSISGQREGIFALEVLQNNVRLCCHQIFSQDSACLLQVDAVKLVMIKRGLEATKAFEDSQELLCRVSVLDPWVLPFEEGSRPDRMGSV